jgi:hypothetical protein
MLREFIERAKNNGCRHAPLDLPQAPGLLDWPGALSEPLPAAPHPDALPAPRRPQAHRSVGWGEIVLPSTPQPDGTLVKALARAWRWQRMLDEGIYATVSEIGDTEHISKSYVSRILRLALLAPDIVDRILAGARISR